MFSYRDFKDRAAPGEIRNAAALDHSSYSRKFASIRGLNSSPPTRTSFVADPKD